MVWRLLILLLCPIWISGCAASRMQRPEPSSEKVRTFAEVYRASKKADIQGRALFEKAGLLPSLLGPGNENYVPVIRPPRVIKVWVPSHVLSSDQRALISGHWAFLMLEESRWFLEEEKP